MTCNKCKNPVEYDIPEPLCGEHWIEWMANGSEEIKKEVTEIVKKSREKKKSC